MFKVGDKVKATQDNYGITTLENEWRGVVIRVYDGFFDAKTTHCLDGDRIGNEYTALEHRQFTKYTELESAEEV